MKKKKKEGNSGCPSRLILIQIAGNVVQRFLDELTCSVEQVPMESFEFHNPHQYDRFNPVIRHLAVCRRCRLVFNNPLNDRLWIKREDSLIAESVRVSSVGG